MEFQKALKINKKEGIVYFHLGNIEMLIGEKSKGIELYNNAIAYGFDNYQVYFSLGLMHEEEEVSDNAINLFPKDTGFAIDEASLLITKKEYKKIDATAGAISSNIESAKYYVNAKINELNRKKESYESFAKSVNNLMENAKRVDKEVAMAISENQERF